MISLEVLKTFAPDRVKIDGSFVVDMLTNQQSAATIHAIVTLAQDLRIETVAEYAETPQLIARLREVGVDYAQGEREWRSRFPCRMCWRAWKRRPSLATTDARAPDRAAAPSRREKTCAARGGKRVAAHKSTRTPGKLFAVPRRRFAEDGARDDVGASGVPTDNLGENQ